MEAVGGWKWRELWLEKVTPEWNLNRMQSYWRRREEGRESEAEGSSLPGVETEAAYYLPGVSGVRGTERGVCWGQGW